MEHEVLFLHSFNFALCGMKWEECDELHALAALPLGKEHQITTEQEAGCPRPILDQIMIPRMSRL